MKKKIMLNRRPAIRRAGTVKKPSLRRAAARRAVVARPAIETCDCGGRLHREMLKDFDFTFYAGIPVSLTEVKGARCESCEKEFIPDGEIIERIVRQLVSTFVSQGPRLNKDQARFLRRRLQLTQQELADRLGIARETVACWETGVSDISPQHDYILRVIALFELIGSSNDNARPTINAVHTDAPIAPQPITVEAR